MNRGFRRIVSKVLLSIMLFSIIIGGNQNTLVSYATDNLNRDLYNYTLDGTDRVLGEDVYESSNTRLKNSYSSSYDQIGNRSSGSYNIPSELNNIVVFIRFKGEAEYVTDNKFGIINNLYNGSDKSLKTYLSDLTYGRSNVSTSFYPMATDGKYLSYEATNVRDYYKVKSSLNPNGYSGNIERSVRENELIEEATRNIATQVKLTADQLDTDGNGAVDNITYVVSGLAESYSDLLWPHKTTASKITYINGKYVSEYNLLLQGTDNVGIMGNIITDLGVIVHEFLHTFGFPDLYRYSGTSQNPVSIWDIMGATPRSPQLPLAYTRIKYGEEVDRIPEISLNGEYVLSPSSSNSKTDTIAYKLKSSLNKSQYFVVEFRKVDEKWDSSLKINNSGLLAYRIDENISSYDGNRNGYPDHVYVFRPGATSASLANGSISDAIISPSLGETSLGKSNVNTTFDNDTLYFQDGINSGIVLSNIKTTSDGKLSFKVEFPTVEGDGSKTNPFIIRTAVDFNNIRNNIDANYKLAANIDMSGISNFNKIPQFNGSIDGNGYSVNNITINKPSEDSIAIFEGLSDTSSISNITFNNIAISGRRMVAGIAVSNSGVINNIKINGNILAGDEYIAGIAQSNSFGGKIQNSVCSVNITGKTYIGGITANNYGGTIENVIFNGAIRSTSGGKIAGIAARNYQISSIVANSYWDVTKAGVEIGAAEGDGELTKGMVGIKTKSTINILEGETSSEVIKLIGNINDINGILSLGKLNINNTNIIELLSIDNINTNNEIIYKFRGNNTGEAIANYSFNVGSNVMKIETNIIVQGNKSNDATLRNLILNDGSVGINFNSSVDNYRVVVSNNVGNIKINADTTNAKARILSGLGTFNLKEGENQFKINSIAEDNYTAKEYIITVVRKTNNIPYINAGNKIITRGEDINLMAGITAYDYEDGDITGRVKVLGTINYNIPGIYKVTYEVFDNDGNRGIKEISITVNTKDPSIATNIGIDRYDTAAKLSESQFSMADTVIIVNGSALADGLTATPLATYLKAPILLVEKSYIPERSKNEIRRLGAKNAIIIGGDGVVGREVESALKTVGINNVKRLSGANRFETSLEIAKYIDINLYDVENIVVSNGYGEADALSIAAAAGRDKMPIILAESNYFTQNTYNWLSSESLNNAYIIGGTGVLTNEVLNKANNITKEDIRNNRLGGKDRYATNAMVIERFYGQFLNKVYVSKGIQLIDALSSGPIAAVNGAPVVLSDGDLSYEQKVVLENKVTNIIVEAGGGISRAVVTALKVCLR